MKAYAPGLPFHRGHKYGVAPREERTAGGIVFASKREMRRYHELVLLERAGRISDLRRQVPYDLAVNGEHIARYVADFTYCENGNLVVEDSKGFRTQTYVMKRKLMRALHGVEIRET